MMVRSLILYAFFLGAPLRATDGEHLYAAQCKSCHGPAGAGVKGKYEKPLAGDKTVPQLAKLIADTMPEDNPGGCVGTDADKVAAYIHAEFYSPAARDKLHPPRIELARLTVPQYRQSVADLIATFRPTPTWGTERGLKAEYYSSRGFRREKRVLDRTDAQVKFDFKDAAPAEKVDANGYSILWTGCVLAPETGEYEFVARTDHSVVLYVNDGKKPVIDALVKSGSETEYKGTAYLIAGRIYPVRLEFIKARIGDVDKKDKPAVPPSKAFIELAWKLPGRSTETIPARQLSPTFAPDVFAINTPFPPDDRSYGWDRGTTVSKAWEQATTEAAIETAAYIGSRIDELANAKPGAADRVTKLKAFTAKFAERAFRRPLTPEQAKIYIEKPFESAADAESAIKRIVLFVLKSPRFLYREVGGGAEQYDTAARLAFALWDSLPDRPLLEAANAGQLKSREHVLKQAERMLADPRAKVKLNGFLLHWLTLDRGGELGKDAKRFPGFDAAAVADLRTSLDLFLDDIVGSSSSDFRQLLLSEETFFNGRLSKLYGGDLPVNADFQKVELDDGDRAGVLTHPYVLASFAYTAESSPIHRGVFLARGLLGLTLKPPQEAFTPLAAAAHPLLNTRERVALQTQGANCQTCHGTINPLGFTLESFDAIGRRRETDNDKPVDATGSYSTRNGTTTKFTGPRDLAKFLAGSDEVHEAFAEQMFHHLAQQSIRAYGPTQLAALKAGFVKSGFSVRKLMAETATAAATRAR